MKKIFLLPLAGIYCLLVHSCSSIDPLSATSAGVKLVQAATISDSYVSQVSHQYVAQLDAQSDIAPADSPYTRRINRLTSSFNGRDGINVKVYITPEVNAFATADGSVRVYSGLMDLMSDEELLGVIGHEIGHYYNHDSRDQFRNALVSSAVRDALVSTGGAVGALSASQFGDIAEALSQSQYSQKQERDADQYGYNFLKNHGINPWAMAMAFEKMQQMESSSPGRFTQLFSSHPDLASRARTMAAQATRDGYKRPAAGSTSTITNPSSGNNPGSGSQTSKEWHF